MIFLHFWNQKQEGCQQQDKQQRAERLQEHCISASRQETHYLEFYHSKIIKPSLSSRKVNLKLILLFRKWTQHRERHWKMSLTASCWLWFLKNWEKMTAESLPSAIQQLPDNSQKPRNHYDYFPEHYRRTWSLNPWTWGWDRVTDLHNTQLSLFSGYKANQIHAGASLHK